LDGRSSSGTDFVLGLGAAEAIDYTKSGLGDTVRALTPDGLAGLIDAVSRAEVAAGTRGKLLIRMAV
jgi:NADPH:quinone reductase-like Zn-dependent oxidoreductase